MLLSLNDDCLRLIIEKLPLPDQISCFFSCQRLQIISTVIWQSTKKVGIDRNDFVKDYPLEYLNEYARCISPNVELLYLKDFDLYQFENLTFPKVDTVLYYNLKNQGWDIENLIDNLFPKLTKLRITANFTGKNLRNLKNLEGLQLSRCTNLQEEHFENIYSELTNIKELLFIPNGIITKNVLKKFVLYEKLEKITLDAWHFYEIYDELFQLKKLREVNFISGKFVKIILDLIISKFGGILHTLRVNEGNGWPMDNICQSILKMIALRKLIFLHIQIEDDQLQAIGATLSTTLEEFYYIKGLPTDSKNYDGLMEIVRHCKKLKILDVTGTNIDLNFIRKVAAIISFEHKKRNQKLILYCSNTKVKIEDLETLQLPKQLQISFECKITAVQQKYTYVTCEWNTIDENN